MNKNPFVQVYYALKTVFSNINYIGFFVLFSILMFFLYVFIPVNTIPGNDFRFQLSIFKPSDYLLMSTMAILSGMLFTMSIYIIKQRANAKSVGNAGAGGIGGIVAAIFGSASCTACIAAFFGFLGAPFVFFLVDIRNYILVIAIAILLTSLFLVSKTINSECKSCVVPNKNLPHKHNHNNE